jgi:Fe(3+) dicitrate transport protein
VSFVRFSCAADWSISKTFFEQNENFIWNASIATDSKYIKSDAPNIEGNKVEFVPLFNIKTGTGIGYKNF